ncbi:MAG: bifunctional oligoribonuclease/PAP phosphatase NrnA [Candidatus Peribacteraceae bacterium]|nr:bifunctional oligoribonuclease/PAP phosphatase NrnA [Candidatus Peribacteraceae bacterium]
MELNPKQISKFEDALLSARKILLLTHKNPDGDALGGLLALFQVLQKAGRDVTAACLDPAPESLKFLPESEKIVNEFDANEFDLVIVLDCGDVHQTGFDKSKPELFDGSRKLVKIDHHPVASEFGDVQIVEPYFCATSSILTRLFEQLEIPIPPDVATCLLTGISTDTGSFRHSNTKPQTLRLAAQLLRKGANNSAIAKNVYRSTPLPALKLWGSVLRSLRQTDEGVTLAVAQRKDFESAGARDEDIAGVVDYVNAVPNAKFSILLSERGGLVKASLRTLDEDTDVAAIAQKFGGGGHVKAAGFAVPGRLEKETRWRVVPPEAENEKG